MPSAAPTRAHRVWMVRILPTSNRTGLNDGLANWRLRSEKRVTAVSYTPLDVYKRQVIDTVRASKVGLCDHEQQVHGVDHALRISGRDL